MNVNILGTGVKASTKSREPFLSLIFINFSLSQKDWYLGHYRIHLNFIKFIEVFRRTIHLFNRLDKVLAIVWISNTNLCYLMTLTPTAFISQCRKKWHILKTSWLLFLWLNKQFQHCWANQRKMWCQVNYHPSTSIK